MTIIATKYLRRGHEACQLAAPFSLKDQPNLKLICNAGSTVASETPRSYQR